MSDPNKPQAGEQNSEKPNSAYADWQDMEVAKDGSTKQSKTNIVKLQAVLDKSGFSELKENEDELKNFFKTTDKEKVYQYLIFINQKLREIPVKERGFHSDTMFAGALVSPDAETQRRVLDYEIDALSRIDSPRYRAASAYYTINSLHLFGDGNGRTARTVFTLLDDRGPDIVANQHFFSHEDNKNPHNTRGSSAKFQIENGIVSTNYFGGLSMLAYLEKNIDRDEEDGFYHELKDSTEQRIKNGGQNILIVTGMIRPGQLDMPEFKENAGFNALNDAEKQRVAKAFSYRDGDRISVSALAMLNFYREKGKQEEFLNRTKKTNSEGQDNWYINIDPEFEGEQRAGHCECKDWTSEDFLRYAELAEDIKEEVLKASIDLFAEPDKYRIMDTTIADFAANAKNHPLGNPVQDEMRFVSS